MKNVYVLHHVRETRNGDEDAKLIGVYSSEQQARSAIDRLKSPPGFCDHPESFSASGYELDVDHWIEGFVSWTDALAD